ncbi:MAG: bacterioferritin [Sandaracinaceae bacterium]
MKGDPRVLERLGELLTDELTSADLYRYFALRLHKQGYLALHARLAHEVQDELHHADLIIARMLLLGGEPNVLARRSKETPSEPKAMLEASLDYELEVRARLNDAIATCDAAGDAGSRLILQELLKETEEDHIDWLETQLHLIEELGLEAYLAEQLGAPAG